MSFISFTTNRRQGHARAPGALSRILKAKGLPAIAARGEQIHGNKVAIVRHPPRSLAGGRDVPGVDGFLTDAPGVPLAIFTADCVPVFLVNQKAGVVGLLHAGWRGTRAEILQKSIRLMRQKWGAKAKETHFWLGPSIGPCCFEVQWDVAQHFPVSRVRKGGRWRVDLQKELLRQGRRLGLRYAKERNQGDCTMHNRRYYSYRRRPDPERQVSVILKIR